MKIFKSFIYVIILLHVSSASMLFSMGQSDENNDFIQDFSETLIVKPYRAFAAADYTINYRTISGNYSSIKYNTQEKEVNGVSFAWKDFGFSAGVGRVTAPEYKDDKSDDMISYDFRFNYIDRGVGCDVYYLKQDGLFLRNKGRNSDGTLPYYDSMDFIILSANLYYILSQDTFSLRAAYDSTDKQKKTADSFLLMINGGVVRVSDDSSLLREERLSVAEDMKGLKKCETGYFSIAPGYSKTYVFFTDFFFNYIFFGGVGTDRTAYSFENEKTIKYELYPRINIKLALGFSGEKFFCGASLNLDFQKISISGDLGTSAGFYDSKFYAGCRFF